ncbi:MAG: hypothetical protein PHO02_07360 [Candidatus Nanoarchaeia archaeon]|nr:hypothetical protein [Candidatus Nanoarchaeia archaeon]
MATSKKLLKGKKKWFTVLASPEFREQIIGETSAYEPQQVAGRTVKVNLGYLANEMRRQSAMVTFKIKGVQDSNAVTSFKRYELAPMLVKRLVKKERDKAEDSFTAQTKDNVMVKIKPFYVSRGFAHNSVFTALRMKARQYLSEELKKTNLSEAIIAVCSGEMQKAVKAELRKVSPLAVAEIRVFEVA